MRLKAYITLQESAYEGNIGFEEMVKFYRVADDEDIENMEKIVKKSDWIAFKKLIKKVLGINLV